MKKWFSLLVIIAFFLSALTGCDLTVSSPGSFGTTTPSSTVTSSNGSFQVGKQTKTTGCIAHGGLPDSACTPGAIFSSATTDQICQTGYASSVRNVPYSEKQQADDEYGITSYYSGQYEVDHLIPLELGGSNDIANLWPEAASPTPGFHQKDQVENYLHDQVCSGALSLKEAQGEISTNWIDVYNRMPK
jgi:hypothetical protein